MNRIAFWNVERLGAGTDEARAKGLELLTSYWQPNLLLTCELTTQCKIPLAQNLTYRKENTYQLCYGAQTAAGDVVLTHVTPGVTDDYKVCAFKGGNDFTQLADRALGYYKLTLGGADVHVYVIHAPSGSGVKAMAYIAAGVREHHAITGGNWIVVGDFNVPPDELKKVAVPKIADLIRNSGVATHYSRQHKTSSELDYALTNIADLKVRSMRHNRWQDLSDHSPILVEWA